LNETLFCNTCEYSIDLQNIACESVQQTDTKFGTTQKLKEHRATNLTVAKKPRNLGYYIR